MGIADIATSALDAASGQVATTPEWSELPMASIEGVEFPIGYSSKRGGQRFVSHVYPGRDGQATETEGTSPRVYELEVPLFAAINPGHYPGLYRQIEAKINETHGRVEYVDPEDGPVNCKVTIHDWRRDPMRRNGGIFALTLEEHYETFDEMIGLLADSKGLALEEAAAIDAGLEDAGVTQEDLIDAFSDDFPLSDEELDCNPLDQVLNMVDTFFETIESGAMAADELASAIDAIRWRFDRIKNFSAMQEIERWSILYSIQACSESCTTHAEKSYSGGPGIVEWMVPHIMSSVQISNKLYGTPDRAFEIEENNPVRNPLFYQKGEYILVLSE